MPPLDLYQEVTSDEIYSMICTAPNKHCALDPASTWVIKQLADVLAPVITNIIIIIIIMYANLYSHYKKITRALYMKIVTGYKLKA